ncbi:MAG: prolyl-tRNA synthetase associated domain-containing protein [Alphaproteobacteria bacterium]|nr:prolyl-tRNA synthetase associated domain-containing protein [Alphaproteobacteria bacterium]
MSETPEIPTSSQKLLTTLEAHTIPYTLHHHTPIFTVEEGLHLKSEIPGTHCRNLFLKDKKGAMFLITAANETQIDLKSLPERLNCGRLSFASKERLMDYLGIYPGAVTPFAAINDTSNAITIILDQSMMEAEIINVHPLDNAMTIGLTPADLLKFFNYTGHEPLTLAF